MPFPQKIDSPSFVNPYNHYSGFPNPNQNPMQFQSNVSPDKFIYGAPKDSQEKKGWASSILDWGKSLLKWSGIAAGAHFLYRLFFKDGINPLKAGANTFNTVKDVVTYPLSFFGNKKSEEAEKTDSEKDENLEENDDIKKEESKEVKKDDKEAKQVTA